MSGPSKRNFELSEEKRELLKTLLQEEGLEDSPARRIRKGEPADSIPCSFAQQRLWFLDQLETGNPNYNLSSLVWINGRLNVPALEQAIVEIIRRHESLRTAFLNKDGMPVLVVGNADRWRMEHRDFSGRPISEAQRESMQLARLERQRSFDLTQSPLFRAILVRINDELHGLFACVHHIVSDAFSLNSFLKELEVLYPAFSQGKPSTLPELPFQYSDFARWQRERWDRGEMTGQLEYWKNQLKGKLPIVDLPSDHTRPPIQSFQGSRLSLEISDTLTTCLRDLSRQEKATLFMTLLAAFKVLLRRYTGLDDLIVGTPVSGRIRPELEPLIGCFVNNLVLRTDLSGNPTFRELLARVRDVALHAFANQDVPFDQLVEILRPERNLSHAPLFQVMFTLQPVPFREEKIGDVTLIPADDIESDSARFDLTVDVFEKKDGLKIYFEYNKSLFEEARITRFKEHYQKLLESVVAKPDQRIDLLPLLTGAECERVLVEWNRTQSEYPKDLCVHHLVEAQAKKTPDRVAVRYGDEHWTYAELDQRANQLAQHLEKLGVVPEVLVGICVERSPLIVLAVLATMKAGGAFVPLDPSFPPERLAFMLEDASVQVLITQEHLAETLPCHGVRSVYLDSISGFTGEAGAGPPIPDLTSENLAYVIYTSGSTGRPKGVQIPHRAVMNFLFSMLSQPGLTDDDRLLSVTTLSFDIAVLEIFLPLVVGAQVVLASRPVAADALRLAELIDLTGATVMQATPATWGMLVEAGWEGAKKLKMLCGGEALSRELADQLLPRGASLWNMYGPTETTIWSMICPVAAGGDSISIGRPIANTQVFLLDSYLQPVPIGVIGELFIGGDGLARGYVGRSELTAERFIPNPFLAEPSARLYKTGDLARYRADGTIEFLGRSDYQVKIRGYRIELGEIEACLRRHPDVLQAVVVAREDVKGNRRLVAYLITRNNIELANGVLGDFVRERLPEYMIPSAFIIMKTFPQTANGKVDRKALPAPDIRRAEEEAAPYRDALDLRLANLWKKVLRIKTVGIRDNFFDLGGNSLLVARLFAHIEKVFRMKIPLATLFQAPTVEQLADIMRKQDWEPHWSSLVEIHPGGSRPPLFLIHGAEGNVLLYRELVKYLGSEQPVYGLQSKGLDGKAELFERLEDMAAHYLNEIESLQPVGPYYLGGYCLGGTIALEMAHQLRAKGEEVALVAMFETYNENSVAPSLRRLFWPFYLLQNVYYHWLNILSLGSKSGWGFFKQKWKVSYSRFFIGVSDIIHNLGFWHPSGEVHKYPHLLIRKVNDEAQRKYIPKAYSGRVALFRPQEHFMGFNDLHFGWSGVAKGGLEVYRFPFYPKAMLVEPFVRILTDRLKACLDKPPHET